MDFSNMSDEEVLQLRNEAIAEAENRLAAMRLRDDTRDLALKAKDLGRSKEEVGAIVASVVNEVFVADEEQVEEPVQPPVEEPEP